MIFSLYHWRSNSIQKKKKKNKKSFDQAESDASLWYPNKEINFFKNASNNEFFHCFSWSALEKATFYSHPHTKKKEENVPMTHRNIALFM